MESILSPSTDGFFVYRGGACGFQSTDQQDLRLWLWRGQELGHVREPQAPGQHPTEGFKWPVSAHL